MVEDNELNLEIERELLEAEGFRVEAARDGREGLDRVRASQPGEFALVLMDIQMPVLDGHAAARALRSLPDPALAAIPIVALSANCYDEDKRRSAESGMDAHLSKPVNMPELLKVMESLLTDR
mgnify:FL=1